jgi:hypothetical protein
LIVRRGGRSKQSKDLQLPFVTSEFATTQELARIEPRNNGRSGSWRQVENSSQWQKLTECDFPNGFG